MTTKVRHWFCRYCKVTIEALPMASAMYCSKGHAMKRVADPVPFEAVAS